MMKSNETSSVSLKMVEVFEKIYLPWTKTSCEINADGP
jgi:hypothetical protein